MRYVNQMNTKRLSKKKQQKLKNLLPYYMTNIL